MVAAGIEPAAFRFVTQHLNHCATAVRAEECTDRNILFAAHDVYKHNIRLLFYSQHINKNAKYIPNLIVSKKIS